MRRCVHSRRAACNKDGVSVTTVNRTFEVVRRILNLCAIKWRHPNGMSWLETIPLIEMERNRQARKPYPLSWDEQSLLFGELPFRSQCPDGAFQGQYRASGAGGVQPAVGVGG